MMPVYKTTFPCYSFSLFRNQFVDPEHPKLLQAMPQTSLAAVSCIFVYPEVHQGWHFFFHVSSESVGFFFGGGGGVRVRRSTAAPASLALDPTAELPHQTPGGTVEERAAPSPTLFLNLTVH